MLTRRNFQLALSSVWLAVPSTVARSQDDETVTVRIRVDETVSGLLQPIELKSYRLSLTIPRTPISSPIKLPPDARFP